MKNARYMTSRLEPALVGPEEGREEAPEELHNEYRGNEQAEIVASSEGESRRHRCRRLGFRFAPRLPPSTENISKRGERLPFLTFRRTRGNIPLELCLASASRVGNKQRTNRVEPPRCLSHCRSPGVVVQFPLGGVPVALLGGGEGFSAVIANEPRRSRETKPFPLPLFYLNISSGASDTGDGENLPWTRECVFSMVEEITAFLVGLTSRYNHLDSPRLPQNIFAPLVRNSVRSYSKPIGASCLTCPTTCIQTGGRAFTTTMMTIIIIISNVAERGFT